MLVCLRSAVGAPEVLASDLGGESSAGGEGD